MPKPMYKLRAKMLEKGVEHTDCIKALNRSTGYWTDRIMQRKSFTMDEVYTLCELLNIPTSEIANYFPGTV